MAEDEKWFEKSSDNGASEDPRGGQRPETKGIRFLPVVVMFLVLATTAGAWGWLWSEKKANSSVVAQFENESIEKEKCGRISLVLSEAEANVPVPGDPAIETETANSELEKCDPKKKLEMPNAKSRAGISETSLSPAAEFGKKDSQIGAETILTDESRQAGQDSATGKLMQPGQIRITSHPEGADVFIDGTLMGTTPFEGILDPGAHRLVLKKKGFTELEDEFTVDQFSTGEPFVYRAELFRDFE